MSNVKLSEQIDAPTLMVEIKASIDSTAGMLRALALSRDERADQAERYPSMGTELDAGHLEAAAAYLAEELALASQFAALLLEVDRGKADQALDTSRLSIMQRRRLANLTSESSHTDAGEGLGAHLSGLKGIILWLSNNTGCCDGLGPHEPALIVIRHRIEAIEALTDLWVTAMMSSRRASRDA